MNLKQRGSRVGVTCENVCSNFDVKKYHFYVHVGENMVHVHTCIAYMYMYTVSSHAHLFIDLKAQVPRFIEIHDLQ